MDAIVTEKPLAPTNNEVTFGDEEIIVSKTDPKGRITYVNRVFMRVAGYEERELLGQPHSIIRHPDMPRTVFKLLWDTISSGEEIFAYVKNITKNGDYYWVFAHVTPTFDASGAIVGYHSNRRTADRSALAKVEPLYAELLTIENSVPNRREGMQLGVNRLEEVLAATGVRYDEFVFSL